jgi:succinoglycan biosynthesis protein ExoA
VRMIDNPERSTPGALNHAIIASRGEIIVRMDAHALMSLDYVSRCVDALERSGADNVGGRMVEIARSEGWFAGPIVEALRHPFGVGNSRFRIGTSKDRWVDTVFGGCWRREVFSRVGMFHPRLDRGQDMEFNQRLRRAGGKILLSPGIVSYYYTRSRLGEFARHNFTNGVWAVVPFALTRGMPVGWRHLAPMAMVMAIGVAAAVDGRVAAAMAGSYAAANLAASAHVAMRSGRWRYLARMPVVFACLHFSYGVGSVWGAVKAAAIWMRGGSNERGGGFEGSGFFERDRARWREGLADADGDARGALRVGSVVRPGRGRA